MIERSSQPGEESFREKRMRRVAGTEGELSKSQFSPSELDQLPPLPEVINPDSVCEWLRQVIPLMNSSSYQRKKLMSVVQRQDFFSKKMSREKPSE